MFYYQVLTPFDSVGQNTAARQFALLLEDILSLEEMLLLGIAGVSELGRIIV